MGYYDIRQIPLFLAGPSIIVSISQDYRHYPHHYDNTYRWYKRRILLMAGDDDEMFMTRSLDVTPK